ncbi:hypothetical protein Asd1617_05909 [Shigella dysenteriae 1617]|uniref:DUF4942 domain-containing protein n=1 Tax=Shigella dysenteriae 1617 TaxID=754093 RepID=A0A0A7A483_SHIDY|nr:hypothetical protein Asd1617_05909 [Shigella dysenteriae 1617]
MREPGVPSPFLAAVTHCPKGPSGRDTQYFICSTSVSHILAVRKTTLLQIDTLIRQLTEISAMTESIGGKTALDWAMKQDFRCGCWLMDKPDTAMKAITRNLDREIWRDLMQCSGMLSLMDAQARDTWYRSLEYDNFPEISEENILSTFEQLHQTEVVNKNWPPS